MKLTLVATLIFVSTILNAQNWQAVGPDDFKQISSQGAGAPEIFTDTLGNAFVAFADSFNNNFRRIIIKQETPGGWVKIAQIQNFSQRYSITADKAGNIYFAADTSIGGTPAISVSKFDGVGWSQLGIPYLLSDTPSSNLIMKIDPVGDPHILYCASGISVFPGMIKWDGVNWVQLGQSIVNTSSGSMDYDFDSYNMPHVLYHDALNNNKQIKKYNGISWVTANTGAPVGNGYLSLKIHKDTMYVAYGTAGYKGGVGQSSPASYVYKFNGTSWISLGNTGGPLSGISNIPVTPSIHLHFDAFDNLYLSGGIVWKVQGGSLTDLGVVGKLAIMGQDTFYAAEAADLYGGKVQVRKRINNMWIDDYFLSIEPFIGGYVGTYSMYYPQSYHSFLIDRYQVPTLFSLLSRAFASYNNGKWDTSFVALPYNSQTPFTIKVDSSNTPYFLTSLQPSSSPPSITSLGLYKLQGKFWTQVGSNISNMFAFSYGSVTFDSNNVPYVAYVDESQFGAKRIRVKKYDGTAWTDASTVVPFVSSNTSYNPQVVSDTGSNISIIFREDTSLQVKRFDGISWNPIGTNIGATSSTNFYIALTDAGNPVVAYLTSTNGLWKPTVKKYDGTSWVTLGLPGFSFGEAANLNLLVANDTPYVAYDDMALGKIVVAKYNGTHFGALGGLAISRDTSSFPVLAKSGNDIYVSYWSHGLFVKKSVSNIITPLYNCLPPSASVSNILDTSADISWSSAVTPVGYEFAINTTNSPAGVIYSTSSSYQANPLLPNTTYYFFVRQICGIDTSAWDTVSFTTTNLSNGAELGSSRSQIKVYPNPATDIIHIEQVGALKERTFVLYDLYGRVVVLQKSADRVSTVSIKHLPAGMYTLRSVGPDKVSSYKIIKR